MSALIAHIRKAAGGMAYGSPLYDWSLKTAAPERMVVRPSDPWAGNAANGQVICEGGLPEGYAGRALHGFEWLRDLRAHGQGSPSAGAQARAQARTMITSWIERHGRWEPVSWDADLTGERVAMWISGFEFFAQFWDEARDDENAFQDLFFESLAKQACHLSRMMAREECLSPGVGGFKAVKGLLYAGLAFEGRESWAAQALGCLKKQIEAQVLSDGSHRSRRPSALVEALQVMLDIRMALAAGALPEPESLGEVIERMGRALLFFRYNDKGLAVFNGGQEGDPEHIDAVISQAGVRGKAPKSLSHGGYEKIMRGRTSVMVDCGKAPGAPFDAHAHAGPLAFEMTYGRERVIVNCGTHNGSGMVAEQWREALRASPAHSMLVLGDRNACEIGEMGHFNRRVRKCPARLEETAEAALLEASHDGYESLNGFIHRRRIYLGGNGEDLRGEDMLSSAVQPGKATPFALRFHLHPRVMASLVRDGREALIRLASGAGWRFHFACGDMAGGRLALEESVYLGRDNTYRKCKQLVICGQVIERKSKIMWGFIREGG